MALNEVAFASEALPDGSVADTNHLWLAEWYLANLNALFTAPLDYDLWRRLDEKSSIASRLYEFLLLNFYGGLPVLRIGYEKLAQFLPVRPERYESGRPAAARAGVPAAQRRGGPRHGRVGREQGRPRLLHFRRGRHLDPRRDGRSRRRTAAGRGRVLGLGRGRGDPQPQAARVDARRRLLPALGGQGRPPADQEGAGAGPR